MTQRYNPADVSAFCSIVAAIVARLIQPKEVE